MGWEDSARGVGWGAAAGLSNLIPAYGTVVSSAMNAAAALGQGYDAYEAYEAGDMERAQDSGVGAGLSALSAIPGVGAVVGGARTGWDLGVTIDRYNGATDEEAPTAAQSISDLIFGD